MARNKSKRNVMKMWRQLPPWAWRLALYKAKDLDAAPGETERYATDGSDQEYRDTFEDANVITSESSRTQWTNNHRPVLDLDFPAALIPSSTKGHFHLFLDKEMDWDTYKKLLKALAAAGILEDGYVTAAIRRKRTAVRLPWQRKVRHDYEKPIGPIMNPPEPVITREEPVSNVGFPEGYTRNPTYSVFRQSEWLAWNGRNSYLTTPILELGTNSFLRVPLVIEDIRGDEANLRSMMEAVQRGLVNARLEMYRLADGSMQLKFIPRREHRRGTVVEDALSRHNGLQSATIFASSEAILQDLGDEGDHYYRPRGGYTRNYIRTTDPESLTVSFNREDDLDYINNIVRARRNQQDVNPWRHWS